jgi:hypothetical protein
MADTVEHNGYSVQHDGAGDNTVGKMFLKTIIWHGFTTATHTLQVTDGNGVVILPAMVCTGTSGNAAAGGVGPIKIPVNRSVNGIITATLGSGKVNYMLG